MLIALIIILALILIYLTITIPYISLDLYYKDYILTIKINHSIFKKQILNDFSKKKNQPPENSSESDNPNSSDTSKPKNDESNAISDKINEFKDRVYSKETGFDKEEFFNIYYEYKALYHEIINIIKKFLRLLRFKIHIPKLYLKFDFGTSNPANTGLIYGSAWGMLGLIYPLLARYFHIVYPTLDITPDFYGTRFDTEIKSIIKVRPIFVINAAFRSLTKPLLTYLFNKIKKGSVKNGR